MAEIKKLPPALAEMVRNALKAKAADQQGELESWIEAIIDDMEFIEELIEALPKEAYDG